MASIWVKVLTAIDSHYRNKVLQARSATLDVEIGNIQSLIEDLKQLRKQWDAIRKLVAENTGIEPMLPERRQRKRKRFADESLSAQDDPNVSQEDHFRNNVFYVLLDCVIGNMTNRYNALESMFGFLMEVLEYE